MSDELYPYWSNRLINSTGKVIITVPAQNHQHLRASLEKSDKDLMAVTGKGVICEGLAALRHPPLVSVDTEHDGRGPGTKDYDKVKECGCQQHDRLNQELTPLSL